MGRSLPAVGLQASTRNDPKRVIKERRIITIMFTTRKAAHTCHTLRAAEVAKGWPAAGGESGGAESGGASLRRGESQAGPS